MAAHDLTKGLVSLEAMDLVPLDALAVMCVGSVAYGWEHDASDVDLVVVTAAPYDDSRLRSISVPLRPRSIRYGTAEVGGRRWEVKYWLDAQVKQTLNKVTHAYFESGHTSRALTAIEETFLEQLPTCLTLRGDEWVDQRREDLHRSAFRALIVGRSLAAADRSIEDAMGQVESGDLPSAVLSARAALGHTIDALLESRSVFGSQRPKWRARRFQLATPPQISYEAYWALETMAGFDRERPTEWIERVLSCCRDLLLEVEM